jgi:hypothetical protein
MANNLPLAVAIANIGRITQGSTESVGAAALALTHRHPESEFTVSDISAAIRDQRRGLLPRLHRTDPSIWFID